MGSSPVVDRRRVQPQHRHATDRASYTSRSSNPCHADHTPDLDASANRYPDTLCHADRSADPNGPTDQYSHSHCHTHIYP